MTLRFTRIYPMDMTKNEKAFDARLKENGFDVLGIRNYKSKMEFLISKNGKEIIYPITKGNNDMSAIWEYFTDYYNTCMEVD